MGVYDSIVRGLSEAIEYEKGNLKGIRTHTVKISPLPIYNAKEIKKIRVELNLSQVAFANIVGVSKKTVEAWESGRNIPKGSSLRMLEILDKNGQDMVKRYVISQ
jgi:putative transcriptional regulator